MKISFPKKDKKIKALKYRFTLTFLLFAVVLMGIIWIMQVGLLSKYYEISMENKVEKSIESIETLYVNTENLSYSDFCDFLGEVSRNADIQFFVEAEDGSFNISSSDLAPGGRIFSSSIKLIGQIAFKLFESPNGEASVIEGNPRGAKTIVHAKTIAAEGKSTINLFAIASLTPIGPAVGIIRSQLLIETVVALILCVFVANFLAKRLAKPITGMSNQAKELAKGNYDITFDGGNEFLEIDELADTLTDTAEELKKADSLQKDLMANVSHDLRTPLTMIKSYAEMIRDLSGDIPEKRAEHLGVIIEETDRLSDLVNDVLTLSKMQAGVTEIEEKEFDFKKSAESVFSTFLVMEQDGFKFNYFCEYPEIIVKGDERKLQQVVANLISNAVRYSDSHKEITVSIKKNEDKVRFSVEDKGIGIAQEDIDKIWHRYERASARGKRTTQGTGLGLSISAEILDKHNAVYGVESQQGKGSTFWFELQYA